MWKQLESFTAVVQEGVKEFSETAIGEVTQSVESLQLGASKVVESAIDVAKQAKGSKTDNGVSLKKWKGNKLGSSSSAHPADVQLPSLTQDSLYASPTAEHEDNTDFGQPLITMQERLRQQHSPKSVHLEEEEAQIHPAAFPETSRTLHSSLSSSSSTHHPAIPLVGLPSTHLPSHMSMPGPISPTHKATPGPTSPLHSATLEPPYLLATPHESAQPRNPPNAAKTGTLVGVQTGPTSPRHTPILKATSGSPGASSGGLDTICASASADASVSGPASAGQMKAASASNWTRPESFVPRPLSPGGLPPQSKLQIVRHAILSGRQIVASEHSLAASAGVTGTTATDDALAVGAADTITGTASNAGLDPTPGAAAAVSSLVAMPVSPSPSPLPLPSPAKTFTRPSLSATPTASAQAGQLKQGLAVGSDPETAGLGDTVDDGALSEHLGWAQAELVKRTHAFNDMKAAYEQVKVLLDHSMQQIERLSMEILTLNSKVDVAEGRAATSTAAADVTKKEAAAVGVELAQTRQQLTDTRKALAKAEAAAQSKSHQEKQASVDLHDMENMRVQLAAAVRKMAAAIEAKGLADERAVAAEAGRAAAEAARAEAEKLRREAQAEAQAAIAAAEAERNTRAEAEGMSEALKQESERRARVFNAAVKAAVGRLQKELEEDREELQGQLSACQSLLSDTRQQLQEALEAAEAAAAETAEHSREAQAAAAQAADSSATAERARAGEAEARAAAQAADGARAAMLQRAEAAGARCQQLEQELEQVREAGQGVQAQLKVLQQSSAGHISELMAEKETMQQRLNTLLEALRSAEQQNEQQVASSRAVLDKAQQAADTAHKQVQQLELELKQLRTSKNVASLFTLPSKEDVLAGLGLELLGKEQLWWKSDAAADSEAGPTGRLGAKTVGSIASSSKRYVGALPMRTLLLVSYLVMLHIAVMVSFTRGGADVLAMTKCERMIASGALSLPPRSF